MSSYLQLSFLSVTRTPAECNTTNRFTASLFRDPAKQVYWAKDGAGGDFLEKQQWRRHTLLCFMISRQKSRWKMRVRENDSMGDCWRMTNSTFPVFLTDNIRLRSPEDRTPMSWLHKETACPRIGYLHVPPVSSFHFVWIKCNHSLSWKPLFKTLADNHRDRRTRTTSVVRLYNQFYFSEPNELDEVMWNLGTKME